MVVVLCEVSPGSESLTLQTTEVQAQGSRMLQKIEALVSMRGPTPRLSGGVLFRRVRTYKHAGSVKN